MHNLVVPINMIVICDMLYFVNSIEIHGFMKFIALKKKRPTVLNVNQTLYYVLMIYNHMYPHTHL